MAATMNNNQNSIMNTTDFTLKKMFDISAKLVNDQEEIHGLDKIHWGKNSWRRLSLIGDETVINLQRAKVYVFSDSVLCLGRVHEHSQSNEAWKDKIGWIIIDESYRDYDGINGEPTELEWNIFPGFTTLQLCDRISDLLSSLGQTPESSQEEFYLCRCSTTFLVTRKAMKKNVWKNAKVVFILAMKCGIGQWSFIGPGSEKKWFSMEENIPQGFWDHSHNCLCKPAQSLRSSRKHM